MQTEIRGPSVRQSTRETHEELADVLTAISVVAKRLARKLSALADAEQDGDGADMMPLTGKGEQQNDGS